VRPGPIAFFVAVSAVLTLATTWAFELSLGSVILLAPVFVVGGAAVAGLALVWSRAFVDSVRGGGRGES